MASAETELERELTCAVCFEFYREPLQLPCLHSFCRPCLTEILASTGGKRISCPDCRKPVEMGKKGLDSLHRNFKLASIVDYFRKALETPRPAPTPSPAPSTGHAPAASPAPSTGHAPTTSCAPSAPIYESSPPPGSAVTLRASTDGGVLSGFRTALTEEEELELVMQQSLAEYQTLKSIRQQVAPFLLEEDQAASSPSLYPNVSRGLLTLSLTSQDGQQATTPSGTAKPQHRGPEVPQGQILHPVVPGARRVKTPFMERLSNILRKDKKGKVPMETPSGAAPVGTGRPSEPRRTSGVPQPIPQSQGESSSLTQVKRASLDGRPPMPPPPVPRYRPLSTDSATPAPPAPHQTPRQGVTVSPLSHSASFPRNANRPLPPVPPQPPTPPSRPTPPTSPASPMAPKPPSCTPVAMETATTTSTEYALAESVQESGEYQNSSPKLRPARRAPPPPPPPKPCTKGMVIPDPTPEDTSPSSSSSVSSITECKAVDSSPTVPKRMVNVYENENSPPSSTKGDNSSHRPALPPRGSLPPL